MVVVASCPWSEVVGQQIVESGGRFAAAFRRNLPPEPLWIDGARLASPVAPKSSPADQLYDHLSEPNKSPPNKVQSNSRPSTAPKQCRPGCLSFRWPPLRRTTCGCQETWRPRAFCRLRIRAILAASPVRRHRPKSVSLLLTGGPEGPDNDSGTPLNERCSGTPRERNTARRAGYRASEGFITPEG